jgi:hypothetical protein
MPMGIIKIFGQGLRTTAGKGRLLAFLWPTYFLFALFVTAPFFFLFQSHFSRSLMGEKMLTGMDILWIGDLVYKHQESTPLLLGWVLGTSLLFLILSAFLNGGVIGRIAAGGEKVTFRGFYGDCGRYFGRFFRVFLFTLAGYFLLAIVGRLISVPFRLWSEGASTEWTTLASSSLRLLVFLLLFSIVRLFFDYVKIALVADDSRRVLRMTLRNFGFLKKRFFSAWALFLMVGLVFVFITLVYLMIAKMLPKTGAGPLLLFLWQQAYFLARLFTGILFFATEFHFLKAHRRPEATFQAENASIDRESVSVEV